MSHRSRKPSLTEKSGLDFLGEVSDVLGQIGSVRKHARQLCTYGRLQRLA